MAIESSLSPQPAVRPVNDADRGRPDAREQRDGKKRQQAPRREAAAPAPNERGQVVGKFIDILA
ncbi:MAG TPA: hypothetical protein VF816_03610 [Rhodocyclaceae bacterium]